MAKNRKEADEKVAANSERTAKGRPFLPGQSGNPTGRPRADPEVKEILKAAAPDAARKLVELLNSKNEKIAFQAAQEILNRTQGKPETMQKIEFSNNDDRKLIICWENNENTDTVQPKKDTD
ncbi:MAG: hypothetical protein IJP60_00215 [Bacilli bacterium]|nr:hypothetical protein [Bacilli bacterium]